MLTQPFYVLDDDGEIRNLIRRYGWATLVSSAGERPPVVSHLPIVLDEQADGRLSVLGHLARTDAELHRLGSRAVTMIVEGPNTYISPAFYPPGTWLPTWNFVVVHLEGRPELLSEGETRAVLERTVEHFEHEAGTGWQLEGSRVYFESLLPQVSGFRLSADRVLAKAKLNQEKGPEVVTSVIAALERSGRDRNADVATSMRRIALGEQSGEA